MRCDVAVDADSRALPVIGTGGLAAVRKSKRGKWRASVLVSVHVLVAAHIAYYLIAGRALSPVEPSESAYTIEQGFVTAGFVFFAVALLGTVVFGRFFCGWGCHIVALQDLCGFLMKKLHVRPKPFRSRFLAFLPIGVAFYMFAWVTVRRLLFEDTPGPFRSFTSHLTTDSFWQTFPGPVIAVLTFLTCGFAAVYFLGAKGYCTYGCPYGALFGPIDNLSFGKIVVSDACEQCGHCTATCTSNVRVHEEVKLYGEVVDPGCMKCLDCVSVCPKGALRFAFGRPSLFKRRTSLPRAKRYDLPLGEEILLAATCIFATVTFFRLYDGPPLLLSAGLGGLTAFLVLKAWHLYRRPSVQIQNLVLKSAGKVKRAGWLFGAGALVWLSFTAHSAFVQWHRTRGLAELDRTETTRADVLSGAFLEKRYSPRHYSAAAAAYRHLSLAGGFGLKDVLEIELGLSWAAMLQSDLPAAEAHARRAVAIAPTERSTTLQNLYEVLLAGHRIPEAIEALQRKLEVGTPSAKDHYQLAWLLAQVGRSEEAAGEYRSCISMAPESAEAHLGLGAVLRRLTRYDEALEHLRAAIAIAPDEAGAHVELGLTYFAMGEQDDALRSFERAVEIDPATSESSAPLRRIIERLRESGAQRSTKR